MKRLLALSKLAMAAALVAFVSCQKENTDPEPTPEPEPTVECTHSDVEYVDAVERTATKMGNVAHWHCNGCNRNFLDADATEEVKNAYLRAKNYSISPALLNRIQHIFPFVPASEQTKGEDGVIPTAVTLLHHKIQEYKFREFSKALFTELNEINEQLALIESQVEEIQKQNAAILAKVEDTPYSDDVDQLFNVGKFIWEQSYRSFENVMTVYSKFDRDEITETELAKNIKGICWDWNNFTYGGDKIYDLTTRYIAQFSGYKTDRGVTMTCPQIFHHFNSDYRLWDHEGYTDRKQMDIEAETVLSLGYFMASLYRENLKPYGYDDNRRQDSLALSGYYDKIEPLVLNDIENMQKAKDAYRYLHDGTTKMFICNKVIIANTDVVVDQIIQDYKKDWSNKIYLLHKDTKSQNTLVTKFNEILNNKYDLGLSNGTSLLVEDYTAILNDYANGDILQILRDTAQIDKMPSFHETRSVEGTDRTLIFKYTSSKLSSFSGSYSKCSKYGHTGWTKKINVTYDEYYAYVNGCGCEGPSKSIDMYCHEMNTNCAQGGGVHVLDRISCDLNLSDSHDQAWAQGKNDNWVPNGAALVFLKKYTGTIFDPLD